MRTRRCSWNAWEAVSLDMIGSVGVLAGDVISTGGHNGRDSVHSSS
jgi:hypothetical protein